MKGDSKMFSFVTHTVNPIAGGYQYDISRSTGKITKIRACAYDCIYCWAKAMINKNHKAFSKKYTGDYRVKQKELRTYLPGSVPFVQDMTDIGCPNIPDDVILEVLEWTRSQPEVTWLFLTKSDSFYDKYYDHLPPKAILGFTIETNKQIPITISKAPQPVRRLLAAQRLSNMIKREHEKEYKLFICIEPVMDFDYTSFLLSIKALKPWSVAIGYDNYRNNLPEPDQEKVRRLIFALLMHDIPVNEKTIR